MLTNTLKLLAYLNTYDHSRFFQNNTFKKNNFEIVEEGFWLYFHCEIISCTILREQIITYSGTYSGIIETSIVYFKDHNYI